MNCTTETKGAEYESSITKTASLTSVDTKKLSRHGRRKALPEEEAAILSRATTQATVAARSILASGGTKATALSTAKAAAESILIPPETGNVKVFLSRRKAKQQVSVIASMALMSASASLTKRPPSNSGKVAMSFMQSPTSSKSTSRGEQQPPSVVQEPARRDDEPSSLGIGSAGSSFAPDDFPIRHRRSKKHHNNGSINPKYSSYSQQDQSWSERRQRHSKMESRARRESDYFECETPTSAGSRTENLANENPNEDPIYSFSGSSYSERKVEKHFIQHKPERPFTCHRPQRPLSCDSSVSSHERKPNKRSDKELFSYTSSDGEDYYQNSVEETLSHESLGSDVERQSNSDAFVMLTNALSCNAPMCHRGKRKGAAVNHLDCRDDTTSDKKSDRSDTEERREEVTSRVESRRDAVASKSSSDDDEEEEDDSAIARILNQMSEDEAEERRKQNVELKNKIKESMEQVVLRALATGELSPRSDARSCSPSFIIKSSPPPPFLGGKIDRISQSRNESPPLHFIPIGREDDDVAPPEDRPVLIENRGPINCSDNCKNNNSGIALELCRSGTNGIDGGGSGSNDDIYRINSSRTSSNPLTRGSRFKNWVLRRKQVKGE
jgi:hypothetical protein